MMFVVMRKVIRNLVIAAAVVAFVGALFTPFAGPTAQAQGEIYKYTKKDGTVVYTDKLSELPSKVRRAYAARKAKEERERARLEASIGKRELARREEEEKRERELRRLVAQADAVRRQQELQAFLRQVKKRRAKIDARKAAWQKRVAEARAKVKALFEKFKKTQEDYRNLAVRADWALFPGQNVEKEKLREDLVKIEEELDAALEELNVRIPADAKKAGIPPGWIR